jgi:hypothetical protein
MAPNKSKPEDENVPKKSQRGKTQVEASVKKYRQNTLTNFLV